LEAIGENVLDADRPDKNFKGARKDLYVFDIMMMDTEAKTQQRLTRSLQFKTEEDIMKAIKDGDSNDKVRTLTFLQATKVKGANQWIRTVPRDKATQLNDDQFRTACRFWLNLSPHSVATGATCPQCRNSDKLDGDPWHALTCSQSKREGVTDRHDAIADILHWAIREAGGMSRREPKGLSADDGLRPDLDCNIGNEDIFVDVTVVHPLAKSRIQGTKPQGTLTAAIQAAKAKEQKYNELASETKRSIVPFAMETYGGMEKRAADFLKKIAMSMKEASTVWTQRVLMGKVRDRIAIAMQKYNAKILQREAQ
jgi:hypothetical protein